MLGTVQGSSDTEVNKADKASALMELLRQTDISNTDKYKEESNSEKREIYEKKNQETIENQYQSLVFKTH